MATYYYNGAQILAPFSINSNSPVYDAETVSLKKIRATQGYQRWELSFECVANDNIAEMFIASVQHINLPKKMIMPQIKEVQDECTLTGSTPGEADIWTGGATQNASSVKIANNDFISGILKKGSFIKFHGHDKVYLLTADLNMNSTTSYEEAYIFPKLNAPVPQTDTLRYGDLCLLTYFQDISNLQGMSFTDGILADMGSINLQEAL
jgi:hypothetical protein